MRPNLLAPLVCCIFIWILNVRPATAANPQDIALYAPLVFDSSGSLTNTSDLDKICAQIAASPQTVVVFMHGWHGTAAPNDNNMVKFREALEQVRDRTFRKSGRLLTGVYLTWPARILPSFLDYLAFWGNQARADRVASGEGIATVIKRLSTAFHPNGREHFIVSGHSFGGRIMGHVAGYHPELFNSVDLWLLANAADDASECRKTITAVSERPYRRGRLPKLVWVTSIHDFATGFAYRLADLRSTPGWDEKLQTYRVAIDNPTKDRPAYSADVEHVSDATGVYAHNLMVEKGLGGHGDVWSEPMIQVLDYYILHQ